MNKKSISELIKSGIKHKSDTLSTITILEDIFAVQEAEFDDQSMLKLLNYLKETLNIESSTVHQLVSKILDKFANLNLLNEYGVSAYSEIKKQQMNETIDAMLERYADMQKLVTNMELEVIYENQSFLFSKSIQISANLENESVVIDFIKNKFENTSIYKSHRFLRFLSILEYVGTKQSIPLLIHLGVKLKKNREGTDLILDILGTILQKEHKVSNELEQLVIDYLNQVSEVWGEDRKLMIYSGVSLIISELRSDLIRKEGREYWDYEPAEIINILTNFKL